MKIVSWNCNMAFRKKANEIIDETIDLLIIQESECLEKVNIEKFPRKPNNAFWFGTDNNKGMSIFSFGKTKIELIEEPGDNDKWIVPFKVSSDKEAFILIAVWAMNHRKNEVINRVGPAFATFTKYEKYLKDDVVIVGDFNDNKIWDGKYFKYGSFSDVQALFSKYNIVSCYHTLRNENFGKETVPTLYWRKSKKTTYHIDYCFCSSNMIKSNSEISIESGDKWLEISDHSPLIISY
ncbi:exonuclease/endonuclease/phosphatase family protein [Clostridium sp. DL1XJH146]